MRKFLLYFFSIWLVTVAGIIAVAGFRGSKTTRTPIEIFDDMDRMPKLRPQTVTKFAAFADGQSSRLPVTGTVARGSAFEDSPVNTGKKADGVTFIESNPLPITANSLKRGQDRYNIYCQPCHSATGDGKGITTKFGMANVANFHDERIIKMADGEIFNTITNGKNLMGPYADKLDVTDRWAVISYVRALELSRLGKKEEIPDAIRTTLK
jgi:hypothetical protein